MPTREILAGGDIKVYPEGYDAQGKSLYYNEKSVRISDRGWDLARSRVLKFGNVDDLALVDVWSPQYPEISSPCLALREYIRTIFESEGREIPVYIFDDHNHSLFAWYEALKEGKIDMETTLMHFDDHLDGSYPPSKLPRYSTLKTVANYTRFLENHMFIAPALSNRLVNTVNWVVFDSKNMKHHHDSGGGISFNIMNSDNAISAVSVENGNYKRVIVDIDIDYFARIEDIDMEEAELKNIREVMKQAGVITIAISPKYIDSNRAIELVKKLLHPTPSRS